jgi:hypothetical protein
MSKLKRVVRIAAGAILVTGIFAGSAAPAGAAAHSHSDGARTILMDTGWGG